MIDKKFKPILAPNDQPNLEELQYPLLASYKLDGIRCIFYKGEILSRSLKQIQNKQLREKFERIRKFSENCDWIMDGEIYSPTLTFQEITSFVMTQDFEDKKSIKKYGKVITIPEDLKFYCFDMILDDNFEEKFKERIFGITDIWVDLKNEMEPVLNTVVNSKEQVEQLFEKALEDGYEGLILRDPNGKYKFGRGTLKEGLIFKCKPYTTFDAKIIDVVQATVVTENAEKKINELGRSVTSKKKNDRILIEKASALVVKYEEHELKVTLAMTDEEKEEVWKNRESYIGKMIEYKGMLIGSKDVPRHSVMIRFRKDKD